MWYKPCSNTTKITFSERSNLHKALKLALAMESAAKDSRTRELHAASNISMELNYVS